MHINAYLSKKTSYFLFKTSEIANSMNYIR